MVRLALPGLLMVEAECLAFEILTLAASYFGTSHLAAQVRILKSSIPNAGSASSYMTSLGSGDCFSFLIQSWYLSYSSYP